MRNKIKKEALEWFANIENYNTQSIEDFIEYVMDKTTESILEELKNQLKDEFLSGNLKHDFIISPDYYIELKLKEVKQNFAQDTIIDIPSDEEQ